MQLDPAAARDPGLPALPRAAARRRRGRRSWSARRRPAGWPTRSATTSPSCSIDEARRPVTRLMTLPTRRGRPRRPRGAGRPATPASMLRAVATAGCPGPRGAAASSTSRTRCAPVAGGRPPAGGRGRRHGRVGHRRRRRRGRARAGRAPCPSSARAATGCPAGSARWTWSSPCRLRGAPRRRSRGRRGRAPRRPRGHRRRGRGRASRPAAAGGRAVHLPVDTQRPHAAGEPVVPLVTAAARGRSTRSGSRASARPARRRRRPARPERLACAAVASRPSSTRPRSWRSSSPGTLPTSGATSDLAARSRRRASLPARRERQARRPSTAP